MHVHLGLLTFHSCFSQRAEDTPSPSTQLFWENCTKKKSAWSRNAGNTGPRMHSIRGRLTGMLQECRMSLLASVNQQKQLKFWAGLHQVRMWPARDRILIILILKKERNGPHKEILFQSFNSLSYTSPCSEYPDFMQVHSLL